MLTQERTRPSRNQGWDSATLSKFLQVNAIPESGLVLKLQSAEGVQKAAGLVKAGRSVAGHNLGVNFLFGDAAIPSFIDEVIKIKGDERSKKPMGTCFDATTLIDMVDLGSIPDQLKPIFSNAKLLEHTFGSLAFLRVQIKEEAIEKYHLPDVVLSKPKEGGVILQNWLTQGNQAMADFGRIMKEVGVQVPAITSLNKSGTGETVHQEDGVLFSQNENIPLFLYDPHLPPRYEQLDDQTDFAVGSNPVLSFDREGVYIERQGYQEPNIWQEHITKNFGVQVTDRSTAGHRFPQMKLPSEFIKKLTEMNNPRILRIGILRYMLGQSIEHIESKLKLKP